LKTLKNAWAGSGYRVMPPIIRADKICEERGFLKKFLNVNFVDLYDIVITILSLCK
jgi:hypothetical protein